MKRTVLLAVVLILLTSALPVSATQLTLSVSGNYFSIAEDDFKTVYGDESFFPEAKITLTVLGNLYLWGSYGYFPASYSWQDWSNKGSADPDLDGKNTSVRHMVSGGAGFFIGYITDLSLKAEMGFCSISNRIESTLTWIDTGAAFSSESETRSGFGFKASLGATYGIGEHLYADLSGSFMYAPVKIDDERVNLGGFQVSLGIGLKL